MIMQNSNIFLASASLSFGPFFFAFSSNLNDWQSSGLFLSRYLDYRRILVWQKVFFLTNATFFFVAKRLGLCQLSITVTGLSNVKRKNFSFLPKFAPKLLLKVLHKK